MLKKNNLNKIIIGIIILIILFLLSFFGYKFYVNKNIRLNLDEKTYYVHHGTTYNLPVATAFDKNDKRDIDRRLTDILINMRDDGTEKEILEKYVGDTDKYLEVGAYE